MSGTGNRAWRALSHRIFHRRAAAGNRKDKLEISYALTYSTPLLVSSFQLLGQQIGTLSTVRMPGESSHAS